MADRPEIVLRLENSLAAALRDYNLHSLAGGVPVEQLALAEYNRLVQDVRVSLSIQYLALHSVAVKQGFYVDKRDQQEMLGTVAQEMGNMSPTEVLQGIQYLKSIYPAIYQSDAAAIDRMESNVVEFISRLPVDQQDKAVAEAKNVQLKARPITSGASEAIELEPLLPSTWSKDGSAPQVIQTYETQQTKLPRVLANELAKSTYTEKQIKMSGNSISVLLKNLWIGALHLSCLVSGVILSSLSLHNTQNHVAQINIINQKNNQEINSQYGFGSTQPTPSPASVPIVLPSRPTITDEVLTPKNIPGNLGNGVIPSDSVFLQSPTPIQQFSPILSNQNSAERMISTYYQDINNRQYQSAWNKLPSGLKQNRKIYPLGYQSFVNFFDRMERVQVNELIVLEETNGQAVVYADLNCEYRKDVKSPLFLRFILNKNDHNQQWQISRINHDPNHKSFCGDPDHKKLSIK